MSEGFISQGFRGRRQQSDLTGRIPPGQYLERGFPVLSAGPTPHTPLETWGFSIGGTLLLVSGGSGIVPLMAMIRHRHKVGSTVPTLLLYSSRSYEEIIYRDELDRLTSGDSMLVVIYTLTGGQPPGWTGYHRRIDSELLREIAWPPEQQPLVFICGPTQFVETAAAGLTSLGYEPARIKTERFGPAGGA